MCNQQSDVKYEHATVKCGHAVGGSVQIGMHIFRAWWISSNWYAYIPCLVNQLKLVCIYSVLGGSAQIGMHIFGGSAQIGMHIFRAW
jgi:hypothetical protein